MKGYEESTYIHGITTSRLLTGVTFSESPEERVGQSVFAHVGKNLIVNLESREVGFSITLASILNSLYLLTYESWQ